MSVTLMDIARRAGVSESTVSKALSNAPDISEATKKRITAIAEELHYVPNYRAQALAKSASRSVGVVVPSINRHYFAELVQHMKLRLQQEDYSVILCSTDKRPDLERAYLDKFKSGQVDGAILTYVIHRESMDSVIDLVDSGIPVSFVNAYWPKVLGSELNKIPFVTFAYQEGGFRSTTYLIDLGHRKIGYIGDHFYREVGLYEGRYEGFRQAMEAKGLAIDHRYVFADCDSLNHGIEKGHQILELSDRPTAMLCMNDEVAIGLMHTLQNGGVRVPEDMSIIAADNIELSKFVTPALTTLQLPKKELGEKAAELLLDLLAHTNVISSRNPIVFPTELIVRKSTCPCKDERPAT